MPPRTLARPSRVAAAVRRACPPLLVLTLGCGEAAPPAPAPAAKPVPVLAPEVKPPAAPHGRVFLVAGESGLAPVACHLGHVPKFSQGDECLELIKVGSSARLESGQVVKVTGEGKAECGEGKAAVVDALPEALRGHAVAPADVDFVEVIPPTTPDEADKAADEPLRGRLRDAVEREHPELAPAKGLKVRQVAQVDLDGDHKPETLVAVTLPGAGEDAAPAFAGLFHAPDGDLPLRKLKGGAGTGVQYMLLGALDLDADGRPELWLNTYDDDGFVWSVEKLGSVDLTELGRRRCEA